MHNKIIAAIAALAMSLVGFIALAPSASAVDPDITTNGWWNQAGPGSEDGRWNYADYKINCNTDSSKPAFQVILLRSSGSTNVLTNKVPEIRELMQRASSIFGASRKTTFGPNATTPKFSDRSPRFVTFQATDGNCYPSLTSLEAPPSLYGGGYDTVTQLWDWLVSIGYDNPRRKYILLHQNPDSTGFAGGASGIQPGDTYSSSNPNNVGGHSNGGVMSIRLTPSNLVSSDSDTMGETAGTVAHEIAHSLGGVQPNSPVHDFSEPSSIYFWHTFYNQDALTNQSGTANEECPSRINSHRFDWCGGQNGYFSQYGETWGSTLNRLDVAQSSFLWGGALAPYPISGARRAPMPEGGVHADPPRSGAHSH